MKRVIVAVLAAAGLAGCVAVPVPYHGDSGYYYGAPAVGVGVDVYPPAYYGYRHPYRPRHHHRHHHPRHRW